MASKHYKQEMPPPGGFGPIEWKQRIHRQRLGGYTAFALFIGGTAAAWVGWYFARRQHILEELEMRDARIAITPFTLAEQDRMFLKQLRANRDEENELMKDVEGWKTGTLYGEPVYHNLRGRFTNPSVEEYFAHMKKWDAFARIYERNYH